MSTDTAPDQPMTLATGTVADVPKPAQALVKALAPGWDARITRARGTLDRRKRGDDGMIDETVDVDSVCLRGRHLDGRGIVALWVRVDGDRTPLGKPSGYSFDMAWRGRHDDETTPAPLNAGEVKAYGSALTPGNALAAVETVRNEQVAKTEARRAAKRNPAPPAAEDTGENALTLELPGPRAIVDEVREGVAA